MCQSFHILFLFFMLYFFGQGENDMSDYTSSHLFQTSLSWIPCHPFVVKEMSLWYLWVTHAEYCHNYFTFWCFFWECSHAFENGKEIGYKYILLLMCISDIPFMVIPKFMYSLELPKQKHHWDGLLRYNVQLFDNNIIFCMLW